jgi:polysaccharide biosynthesis transport protein
MKASDWLGEEVTKIRQQLEISEAAVDDFRRKSGLLPVKGGTIPAERLADLNAQLSNAHAERMRAELRLQAAQESDLETLPDIVASPTIQRLRKDLGDINLSIFEIHAHSPSYKLTDLEAKAAMLQTAIKEETKRIIATLSSEVQLARKKEAELTPVSGSFSWSARPLPTARSMKRSWLVTSRRRSRRACRHRMRG